MSLAVGTKLGPYEILTPLGAGGMGEVYRARDAKLNRDVAIKVLSSALADDPSSLARFEREAQSVAQLSHPNILNIFDFGKHGGIAYAAMELLEGETLRQRLTTGALAPRKAVDYAVQIAHGLAAAHDKGIVHRDLKPDNLFITAGDRLKILDFGLAKAFHVGASAATVAPAVNTAAGTVLGTVGYMAPEQLRGRDTDHRADIFAFGCVLYEMISGKRAFSGETPADTISAILNAEPADLDSIRTGIPSALDRIVRRCLEKKPELRFQSSQDLAFALEGATTDSGSRTASSASAVPSSASPRGGSRLLPFTLLAFAAGAGLVFAWAQAGRAVAMPALELAISPPDGAEFRIGQNSGNVILSRDGTRVAFVAASPKGEQLWVRALDRDDARPLPGTDGASYPFWAADGRSIGFFAAGKLRTIDVSGGLPQAIADATNGRGGAWGDDGTILFALAPAEGGTIFRIATSGGQRQAVTHLDPARGENAHYWPELLPGGRKFLYFIRSINPEHNGIYIGHVDGSRPSVRLVSSLSSGVFAMAADGAYLLWVRDGDLLAQPLDVDADVLRGSATVIASGVRVEDSQRVTFASASRTGIVAWATTRAETKHLLMKSRQGLVLSTLPFEPGRPQQPAISPDGLRLLVPSPARGTADIWLYDMRDRTARQVTTGPDFDEWPVWSSDGRSFAFRDGNGLSRATLDGSFSLVDLGADQAMQLSGWSPDGRFLVFSMPRADTGLDLWALPLDRPAAAASITADRGSEESGAFSPDGRWLAFTADRGGRAEVVVASVEATQSEMRLGKVRIPVSTEGGSRARWRADGKELFFKGLDGRLYAVPVKPAGSGLVFGTPVPLFRGPNLTDWDVMPDGQQFVVVDEPYAASQTLRVLTNWPARLKQ